MNKKITKEAKFIKKADCVGDGELWEMSPPLEGSKFVVTSIAYAFQVETYIFPANEEGRITDWGELDGSEQGIGDHEVAIKNAGYEVIR